MKLVRSISLLLFVLLSPFADAANLHLDVAKNFGAPGTFAAEEIRREAAAKGMTVVEDATAIRVSLTVGNNTKASTQSYRIQRDGSNIRVIGADAVGAMYGGLDVAEAIRHGTLDSLRDSEHKPHIERRGIKFNIPLDLRTPSYSDPADAAQ